VNAFLNQELKFKDIINIVSNVMNKHKNKTNPSIQDIIYQDRETRKLTSQFCTENKK